MTQAVKARTLARACPSREENAAEIKMKLSDGGLMFIGPGLPESVREHLFSADQALPPGSNNEELHKAGFSSMAARCLEGYNTTVLLFGQSKSGKSYAVLGSSEDPGFLPRFSDELFDGISRLKTSCDFLITVSTCEIHDNGSVHDLLNPTEIDLRLYKNNHSGLVVEGLSELLVYSSQELIHLYNQGLRVLGLRLVDEDLTHRSAVMLTITVEQKPRGPSHEAVRSLIRILNLSDSSQDPSSGKFKSSVAQTFTEVVSQKAERRSIDPHQSFSHPKAAKLFEDALDKNNQLVYLSTFSLQGKDIPNTVLALKMGESVKQLLLHPQINASNVASTVTDLRAEITKVRNKINSKSLNELPSPEDVSMLEELTLELQLTKRQTWEEKTKASQIFEAERRTTLAERGIIDLVFDLGFTEPTEVKEKIQNLQEEREKLVTTYKQKRRQVDQSKEHLQTIIAEYSKLGEAGKSGSDEAKRKLAVIQEMKDQLKSQNDGLKKIKQSMKEIQDQLKTNKENAQNAVNAMKSSFELYQRIEVDKLERLEKENLSLLTEEVDRVNMELEQEKADIESRSRAGDAQTDQGTFYAREKEVAELRAERNILALKAKMIESEKKAVHRSLEDSYRRYNVDLETQQLQHFQVFRSYRQVIEEQKAVIDERYRTLLEDAVHDAVFLSSRNQELLYENLQLKQDMAELRDRLGRLEGQLADRT